MESETHAPNKLHRIKLKEKKKYFEVKTSDKNQLRIRED